MWELFCACVVNLKQKSIKFYFIFFFPFFFFLPRKIFKVFHIYLNTHSVKYWMKFQEIVCFETLSPESVPPRHLSNTPPQPPLPEVHENVLSVNFKISKLFFSELTSLLIVWIMIRNLHLTKEAFLSAFNVDNFTYSAVKSWTARCNYILVNSTIPNSSTFK